MLTLAQIKNSSVASVAGCDVNSAQFIQYVNDAVRMLCNMGEWFGTVKAMRGMALNGTIVWPEGVDSVLAFNDQCRPATVANYWYEFFPVNENPGFYQFFDGYLNNGLDSRFGLGMPKSVLRFSGTSPVYIQPSIQNPFAVQVTADSPADYGKTVTIYGIDTNAQEVVSKRSDGSTQRGIVLTLGPGIVFNPTVFQSIPNVVKDLTTGNVRLWIYTPTIQQPQQIAVYSGSQTNPQFLSSHFRSPRLNCVQSVEALVKLSPMPVSQDSDLVVIDNIDAIKTMVQSIRFGESGDKTTGNEYEVDAVRRLNAELRTRFPNQQVVARVNPIGKHVIYSPI